ncbi:MAG: trypsin-like peptidase domain-containing protein, partial [Desulfarculaceae bacterium]
MKLLIRSHPAWLKCSILLICLTLAPALSAAATSRRMTPVVRAVKAVAPAVVSITSKSRQRVRLFETGDETLDRFFEDFFGPTQRQTTSLGSGVIIDGRGGLIATNSHVISRSSQITVHLSDKRTFRAQVVGADPDSDLAVLRIKAREALPQVVMGNSNDLMIGESVIAIGNPFGLSHTVTVGVISALKRSVRAGKKRWIHDLIQTDASINPGNSGGPLLNADGEVVGINTAIYQGARGIGFAIPVNRMKRIADDLVRYGEVTPSWLGLFLQDLDPKLAAHYGQKGPHGALVLHVLPKSPAARAGIERGQLITEINGNRLDNASHYQAVLGAAAVGQTLTLKVKKPNQRFKVLQVKAEAFPLERALEVSWLKLGLTVADLDETSAYRHRVPLGSAVVINKLRQPSRAASL